MRYCVDTGFHFSGVYTQEWNCCVGWKLYTQSLELGELLNGWAILLPPAPPRAWHCMRAPFQIRAQTTPETGIVMTKTLGQREGTWLLRRHSATRAGFQPWDCPPSFRKPDVQAKTVGFRSLRGDGQKEGIREYKALQWRRTLPVLGIETSKPLLFLLY